MNKDPTREEKQAYGLRRLSKVEAQFSSCWSAVQGILFLSAVFLIPKAVTVREERVVNVEGPEEQAPSLGSERSRGIVRLEAWQ